MNRALLLAGSFLLSCDGGSGGPAAGGGDASAGEGGGGGGGPATGAWCASRVAASGYCWDFDGNGALADALAPFHFEGEGTFAEETGAGLFASAPRAIRFDAPPRDAASGSRLAGTAVGAGSPTSVLALDAKLRIVAVPAKGELLVVRLASVPGFTIQVGTSATETWVSAGVGALTKTPSAWPFNVGTWHGIQIRLDFAAKLLAFRLDGAEALRTAFEATPAAKLFVEVGAIVLPGGGGDLSVDGASVQIDDVSLSL